MAVSAAFVSKMVSSPRVRCCSSHTTSEPTATVRSLIAVLLLVMAIAMAAGLL